MLSCKSTCIVMGCINLRIITHLGFGFLGPKVYYKDYIQIARVTFFILKKFLIIENWVIVELLVLIHHLCRIVKHLLLLLLHYFHYTHGYAYFTAATAGIITLANERFHCFQSLKNFSYQGVSFLHSCSYSVRESSSNVNLMGFQLHRVHSVHNLE